MKSITVRSNEREEMVEITREVESGLPDGNGVCVLFTQHTTCGLTINENADPDVKSDMLGWLRWLIPQYPDSPGRGAGVPGFKHFEHNSDVAGDIFVRIRRAAGTEGDRDRGLRKHLPANNANDRE